MKLFYIFLLIVLAVSIGVVSSCTRSSDQGSAPTPSADPKTGHPIQPKAGAACSICHESDRPAQHNVGVDCSKCHEVAIPGFQFTHFVVEHDPIATCLPCHESTRPSSTHNAGQDCIRCHIDPAKPWSQSGGSPHPLNNPRPTSCAVCHESDRPTGHFGTTDCAQCHNPRDATTTAFVFTHKVNGTTVSTCSGCHAADRPSVVVNRFSHTLAGTGDCSGCHKQPGVSWSGGIYNHSPVPASCATCHAVNRPSGHSTDDCKGCHLQPGVTWAGAAFNHTPTPASCNSCHLSDRPPLNQEYPIPGEDTFTHGRGPHENYDCTRCHTRPGVSWVVLNPSNVCGQCH